MLVPARDKRDGGQRRQRDEREGHREPGGMAAALTRLSRTRWLEVRTPQSRAQARDEHLGIVAAVRDRDADKAPALVVAHCHGTRDRLLSYLAGERRRLRGRGFAIIESSTAPPPLQAS